MGREDKRPAAHRLQGELADPEPPRAAGSLYQASTVRTGTGFFTEGQWQEPENEDFEGRLLLLDIARVRERYPTADCQMFYCMEDTGTEVIGFFLKDNSMDCFQHSDFLGELKPEFTPAWVPDALEDMGCSPGQLQDMGMRMNF